MTMAFIGLFRSRRNFHTSRLLKNQYRGSWNSPRLQNPNISMPTNEFVSPGKPRRTNMIYVCGFGATGALGMPKFYKPENKDLTDNKHKDVMLSTFRRLGIVSIRDQIKDVACGHGFTVIAANLQDSDHTVLGFGLNNHSQIGLQCSRPGYPLEIVSTPSTIVLPTKSTIQKVACGRSHSIFLDLDGQVLSVGNNAFGQCGRPIIENEITFGQNNVHIVKDLPSNVIDIECGQDHSFFLTNDGKLYACGWGADGQTGLGHYENVSKPTLVRGDIENVKISKVSSFADTVLALDDQGNLFGWGNTEYAQFRMLTNSETQQFNTPQNLKLRRLPGKIVDIAAGGTMCAILNDLGQVYVWGFGILGRGPQVDQSSRPSLIPETLFGANSYNPSVKVAKIYASLTHFAAITNTHDLYTWGRNRGSALGFAHSRDQYFPMQVNMNLTQVKKVALGVDHTCALVEQIY